MKPPVVWRESGEKITLKDADWLGAGGEGSVWRVDALSAVKVASDPAAYAPKAQKARLLCAIRHPSLITPTGLALDASGSPIGHFMPLAKGEPLARYFSPSWQQKNNVTRADLIALADRMRLAIERLHAEGVVGGDINEFNWTVAHGAPLLFDCDSWGVGGLPVSAMLPSIADPLARGRYGPESDWFAFAVLAFQLFIGAHPYRGSHPDFGRQAMSERMAAGASLFDPRSNAPPAARDLSEIPPGLRRWMESVLSAAGSRLAPPPAAQWDRSATPSPTPERFPASVAAGPLCVSVMETLRLPCAFSRWVGPGLALLADGSALDLASKTRSGAPANARAGLRLSDGSLAWAQFDDASGELTVSSGALSARFKAGPNARLAALQGRLFIVKDSSWQEMAAKRLGQTLILAPCASGAASLRDASIEDGALLSPSIAGALLLRPAPAACQGLSPAQSPARPGARLIEAASAPGLDAFSLRQANGDWLTLFLIRGKPAGSAPLKAIGVHALGPNSALCLFETGEATLFDLASKNAKTGHAGSEWINAQSFAGSLWAPSADRMSLRRGAAL